MYVQGGILTPVQVTCNTCLRLVFAHLALQFTACDLYKFRYRNKKKVYTGSSKAPKAGAVLLGHRNTKGSRQRKTITAIGEVGTARQPGSSVFCKSEEQTVMCSVSVFRKEGRRGGGGLI